jgi:cytochrome c oxidase subunit 6b
MDKILSSLKTTKSDLKNYPSTNQYHYCWQKYNEFVLCEKRGGDEETCKGARQLAASICPDLDMETWDEQRETGIFLGVQPNK